MKSKLVLALTLAGATTASLAGPTEDQIRFRQSAYSFAAWSLGKVKAQVVTKPETYNKEQVAAAANAIAAIANSGLGALYGTGTDQGIGWQKTRLKPEFFQKTDDAKKLGEAFIKESNELAKVAQTGDIAAIKEQFGKTSETCKSCHDAFRLKDVAE
jgi:cytochrome c556